MSPRICRALRAAFNLPRIPQTHLAPQRQLYRALKRRYLKSTPAKRAIMLANAAALSETT